MNLSMENKSISDLSANTSTSTSPRAQLNAGKREFEENKVQLINLNKITEGSKNSGTLT